MRRFHVVLVCVAAAVAVAVVIVAVPVFRTGSDKTNTTVPSRLLFGTFVPTSATANHAQTYARVESRLGRAASIDRVYSSWDDRQPVPALVDDRAHGRLPLLSIRPQLRDGSKLSWAALASGSYDAEIIQQATALRNFASPVVLAFHHEADVASGFGSAAQFVAAYRHYVALFRSAGASNVRFAVIFVPITFASSKIGAWYPGDAYVDWIGTDAYNWNRCSGGSAWRSLKQAAAAFYRWGSARNKRLVLAEWGSAADPGDRARRAAWLTDAVATMRQWPALRAAIYFDSVGSCDWRLTEPSMPWSAYVTAAHTATANGEASAVLLDRSATAPAPLNVTLQAGGSTGTGHVTGNGIISYSFDPGDGTGVVQRTGQPGALTHQYRNPGTFTAWLTVHDATGASATTSTVIDAT